MATPHPPLSPIATITEQGGAANAGGVTSSIGASLLDEKNGAVPSMSEEDITALLSRLSQKETVTSVLILSRSDGAVIRVSGALSDTSSSLDNSSTNTKDSSTNTHTHTHRHTHSNSISSSNLGGGRNANILAEYASVVWRLVQASEELVINELGQLGGLVGAGTSAMLALSSVPTSSSAPGEVVGDELRLLRVRTRRGELVVVPDARFILVVVHDSPGK